MEPSHSRLFVRSFDTDWVPKLMKIARDAPEKYHGCEYFGADGIYLSLSKQVFFFNYSLL